MEIQSLKPETPFRITLTRLVVLIITISTICFTLGQIYFSFSNDIQTLKTRVQTLENICFKGTNNERH